MIIVKNMELTEPKKSTDAGFPSVPVAQKGLKSDVLYNTKLPSNMGRKM